MSLLPLRRAVPHGVLASLLVAGTAFSGVRAAGQVAAPETGTTGAAVTQDGWWNRLQGPVEGEPEGNPVRPFVPALPAPPTVPPDAIVASAVAGQIDKVAAVGVEVVLPEEVLLHGLTLRLKESSGEGANVNSAHAQVLACPARDPWGGHKNANWADRPQPDCDVEQVRGVRAADGTWTFDLTPLGVLWTDPDTPLPQNGVVLSVDPTASLALTQVSWLDYDSGKVAVELLETGVSSKAYMMAVPAGHMPAVAVPTDDILARPSVAAGETPWDGTQPADGTAGTVSPSTPPLASSPGDPLPSPPDRDRLTSGGEAAAGLPSPGQVALPIAPRSRSQQQAAPVRPSVGFWEGLPTSTALLIPVALGFALLVGSALGPSGRPQPVGSRAGGLSRALARRTGAGNAAN